MAIALAFVLWIIGIVLMLGGKIADNLLRRLERKLAEKSQHKKFEDNSAHIAYGAGKGIVDAIPWYAVNTWFAVVGLIIFALGFVPLSYHYVMESSSGSMMISLIS